MSLADNMKRTCEEIISSHDTRIAGVGILIRDVQKMLDDMAEARRKMADAQSKALSKFAKDLMGDVKDLIGEFQEKHQNMSEEQRKTLSGFVADLRESSGKMLSNFHGDRVKLNARLRHDLGKSKADLEKSVRARLQEFSDERSGMFKQLKKELTAYVTSLALESKKLLGTYRHERKELSDDLAKMSAHWRSVQAHYKKKRRPTSLADLTEEKSSAEENQKGKKARIIAQKAKPDVEALFLELLEGTLAGISLKAASATLGVASVVLGKSVKKLVENGKIRKEGSLYFPAV